MRSRIAVFEGRPPSGSVRVFAGYGAPFRGAGRRLGGPIFSNPRAQRPSMSLGSLGRRAYSVPAERYIPSDSRGGYGPARKPRAGYKVKRMKDTPAMKRAQKRFAKAAKKCSRTSSGRKSFPACMRRELRKKSKR